MKHPISLLVLALSQLSAGHNHEHDHQQEFSAKRLIDLSAKWGIDVSLVTDSDPIYADYVIVGILRHRNFRTSAS